MGEKRLYIFKETDGKKVDISDHIELEGKSNPFGWSNYEVLYQEQVIGKVYCTVPQDFIEGYSFTIKTNNEEDK